MADTENILKINRDRENVLTFQVNIEGIDVNDISIRFCIDADNMLVCFPCELMADNDYKVTIPTLGDLVGYGNYACKIEVVANEYFFIAMTGTLKIVGTPNVKASVKADEEGDEKTTEPTGPSVSASAIKVTGADEESDDVVESVVSSPEVQESASKDQQVRQILNELGFKRKTGQHQFKSLKTFITR